MGTYVLRSTVGLVCVWAALQARAEEPLRLENTCLGLSFDRKTGALMAIHNRLYGRDLPGPR